MDGGSIYKDHKWIAKHLTDEIDKIGPSVVMHNVGDNAAVNIAAGKLVTERFPHIIWGGCVAHGVDLVCHDLGRMEWISDIFDRCKNVVKFVKNHHMTNTLFMDKFSNGLQLLKPGEKRFATNYIMLDRAFELRFCLGAMVVSSEWQEYSEHVQGMANRENLRSVKSTVLDEAFWNEVEDLRAIMEPIFSLLRQVDANKEFMGVVYWESWETHERLLRFKEDSPVKSNLLTIERCRSIASCFHARWKAWTNILQATAMCLNPYFLYHSEFMEAFERKEVKDQFRKYCFVFGEHIKGFVGDRLEEYVEACEVEVASIMMREAIFGEKCCRNFANNNKRCPGRWWHMYGDPCPNISEIAKNILPLSCTASACERNWSSYGFVHTESRNCLKSETAEKLVYIYHNACIKKQLQNYPAEEHRIVK